MVLLSTTFTRLVSCPRRNMDHTSVARIYNLKLKTCAFTVFVNTDKKNWNKMMTDCGKANETLYFLNPSLFIPHSCLWWRFFFRVLLKPSSGYLSRVVLLIKAFGEKCLSMVDDFCSSTLRSTSHKYCYLWQRREKTVWIKSYFVFQPNWETTTHVSTLRGTCRSTGLFLIRRKNWKKL